MMYKTYLVIGWVAFALKTHIRYGMKDSTGRYIGMKHLAMLILAHPYWNEPSLQKKKKKSAYRGGFENLKTASTDINAL